MDLQTNVLEKSVFIETFGCQMNENDTDRMLSNLRNLNYKKTLNPKDADLILVNTCSVRDKAEQKVYSLVGRYKNFKKEKPNLIIGISGCVAQQEGEKLLKKIPFIDLVVGTHNIHKISHIVEEISENRIRKSETKFYKEIQENEFPTSVSTDKLKAYVTITRGCDNYCTFCVVPFVRGREVSRTSSSIIEEIKTLSEQGVKEVTLLGQNVNSYGSDANHARGEKEVSFTELLERVCKIDKIERVRFVTSHPKDISDELIYLFGKEKKLSRSIHLPVQCGSDKLLERMKRLYTVKEYMDKVNLIKKLYKDMAITTDIIVGFPGESEEDFKATMDLVKEVRYDMIFSFNYSPRPNTKALEYTDLVDEDVMKKRLYELQDLQRKIDREKNEALVGMELEVLVEGMSKESSDLSIELSGRTNCNRIVNFSFANKNPEQIIGNIAKVKIKQGFQNSLKGELII